MTGALILAIETSSLRGSVALGRGQAVAGWRALSAQRRHTTELMPTVAELLAGAGVRPADVGCVCFSQGPGSFTGLRVAATVARMWQSALGAEVVGVPTLEVIARNALALPERPRRLAVLVDARQDKVFAARFELDGKDGLRMLEPARMYLLADWLARLSAPCAVLGDGVERHRAELERAGLSVLPEPLGVPDARQVLAIGRRLAAEGRFLEPGEILPAYLRPPECEEVYEKRRAAARARRGE